MSALGPVRDRHRGRITRQLEAPGQRGSTPAAAVSGPNKAASWSVPARLDKPDKASPLRSPPTAMPSSWAGLAITRTLGRRGALAATGLSGPSRATSWLAPARPNVPHKAFPSRCPPLDAGRRRPRGDGRRHRETPWSWPSPRVRPTMSIIAATSPVIGQPAGGSPYLSTSVYWTLIGHTPPASR
jgi:hypothetical protein